MSNLNVFSKIISGTSSVPIIAFDSEYVQSDEFDGNQVLCYSYAIGVDEQYVTGIIYTETGERKSRYTLEKFLSIAIKHALELEVLSCWPESMIVGAHFLRADISSFQSNDGMPFTDKLMALRKTVVSNKSALHVELDKHEDDSAVNVYDKSNHAHRIKLRLYDSMLFAPAGKGLADIGKMVGIPKMYIPAPYSISRMDQFLKEQPELFERYAITDAEICYKYMVMTRNFVSEEFGLTSLPKTISGMALKAFKSSIGENYLNYFGLEAKRKEIFSKETGKARTINIVEPTAEADALYSFATRCYHGGRNESYLAGPTDVGIWRDFDVPSCYTTAAAMLKPLNYVALKHVTDPREFCGDVFGMAYVRFSFPKNTRFPCLPVKTDGFGLHYPLEGKSHCTAPEIELALSMGAQIEILIGFIIPWHGDSYVFVDFMRGVKMKRLQYAKNSFEERMWKEMGNSIYGKLAQGLNGKTAYDLANDTSSDIPASEITNPYFALFITGFCRALLSEMIASIPSVRTVVSVTTDGFLTDATLDEIDFSGTLCQRFRAAYNQINTEGTEILELKHAVRQLIAMKTRGQLTAIPLDGYASVLAKAGVQVPSYAEPHQYMLQLYLNRYPGQVVNSHRLTPVRKQVKLKRDMIMERVQVRLSLEPDFKRNLINPRMIKVGQHEHIAFESVPFVTSEQGVRVRRIFDVWRQRNCLKTMTDWLNWQDFLAIYSLKSGKKLRVNPGETPDQLFARLFLRIYVKSALGVNRDMTNKAFAEYMTELGYDTKPSALGSALRAELVLGIIPVCPSTVRLLKQILERYPSFEYQQFFAPDGLEELAAQLA